MIEKIKVIESRDKVSETSCFFLNTIAYLYIATHKTGDSGLISINGAFRSYLADQVAPFS